MAQNEFTKKYASIGLPGQVILDAGLNVFALELLVESFTDCMGGKSEPIEFTFRGVKIRLQIDT